jgi:hypothetical protein
LRKTTAQFAADAKKRFPFPAQLAPGGPANGRAQVGYSADVIELLNASDEDWVDVELWANRQYVVHVPKIAAGKQRVTTINFTMLFDDKGHSFPVNNGRPDKMVRQLEMVRDGRSTRSRCGWRTRGRSREPEARSAEGKTVRTAPLVAPSTGSRLLAPLFFPPPSTFLTWPPSRRRISWGPCVYTFCSARSPPAALSGPTPRRGRRICSACRRRAPRARRPRSARRGRAWSISSTTSSTPAEQFKALEGRAFSAALRYGGIPNAVRFEQNAAGTSATLAIPATGFRREFTGNSRSDVEDQIRDFLLKEGTSAYAKFLRTVNERSLIGVTDGNPLAATAVFADSAFTKFGLLRTPLDPGQTYDDSAGSGVRFDVAGGTADTDEGDGYFVSGSISSTWRFNGNVALSLATPFTYRDIEGAQVFVGGTELALPIVLARWGGSSGPRGNAPWGDGSRGGIGSWQLTPSFLAGAAGSVDLAAGGTFLGGGLTSALKIPLAPRTAVTVGNGIYAFEGFPIGFGEYDFDTDLTQQVLKNGVKLTQGLGPGTFADVGVAHTLFLQDAAMDSYLSPTAGIGVRFGERAGLRVAYRADLGDEFTAQGGSVQVYLNY